MKVLKPIALFPGIRRQPLTVQAFLSNESNHYQGEPGEILYESQDGRPVVLIGNVSDIIPNLLVTLTGADGEKNGVSSRAESL